MIQLKVIVNKLNKRKEPTIDFADKSNIAGVVFLGFTFESENMIENNLGKWYVDRDGYYYWSGGVNEISSLNITSRPVIANAKTGKAAIPLPSFPSIDLPVNYAKCKLTANWLDTHFGEKCEAIVTNTPFTKELIYAIACKETAIYFYDWTKDHAPEEVLGRCVFDATGDVSGARNAFPKNTSEFVEKYSQKIADDLIGEANKTRAMRGFGPKQWVYAGYGIFQYDLQNIQTDETFFTQKLWYNMDDCLARIMKELNAKWKLHPNDLFHTIMAYNGSGSRAEIYANDVIQFINWISSNP